MPFPETERIIYRNNPLTKVICQLRFPPILSIETELPARFQEKIRETYPSFQEKTEFTIKFPDEKNPQGARKNFEFGSEDGQWKINLTRTFISLSSSNYKRWEEFLDFLTTPLNAILEIYSPKLFTRIGLRYNDVIDKTQLNLTDARWGDLLQPQIAGVLSDPFINQYVLGTRNTVEIELSDNVSMVRIHHGLVDAEGHDDICYLIDSDFFTEHRTNPGQVIDKLNYFNQRGTRLLRWCIMDALHNALEPEGL